MQNYNSKFKTFNIVFFGSSNFAAPSLRALLDTRHKIQAVVTQPDRKKGRGLHLEATPVKSIAQDAGLKIYQPEDINSLEAVKLLKDLKPDLFVVMAYGQILSQEILDIPQIFSLNIHASLLPEYRGAAPINWALINGDKITGVTAIKMTECLDAGDVISQDAIEVNDFDTALTLEEKLSCEAGELLIRTLKAVKAGAYKLMPQDNEKASLAPKLKKEDGLINWQKPAQDISNLIRGCLGWPGAFTYYKGKMFKVCKTRVSEYRSIGVSGEIIRVYKEGIEVSTGKDNLIIEELQIEGKRRMNVEEFIAGHRIKAGEVLGKLIA